MCHVGIGGVQTETETTREKEKETAPEHDTWQTRGRRALRETKKCL